MGGDQRIWFPRFSRRTVLSDLSNSPPPSSKSSKSSKSAMSMARMTESPTKVPITSENQSSKAATNGRVNTVAEQVNILVACSEAHNRKLDNLTKIMKAVAAKNGVSVDILNDGPDVENLAENFDGVAI